MLWGGEAVWGLMRWSGRMGEVCVVDMWFVVALVVAEKGVQGSMWSEDHKALQLVVLSEKVLELEWT